MPEPLARLTLELRIKEDLPPGSEEVLEEAVPKLQSRWEQLVTYSIEPLTETAVADYAEFVTLDYEQEWVGRS